jgi:ABC-type nickel/cobalt efflux system permease component RcnA
MNVVPLTIVISLCLVFTFVIFFLREQWSGRVSGAEHDSLLPLADETPQVVPTRPTLERHPAHAHDHAEACGCRDGSRPPCVGCLRQHNS